MSRPPRSGERPRQFSLRIPEDLAVKIDQLKEKEGTDSTVIILRAIKFWLEVDGKATNDHDLLGRITAIETELQEQKENECKRFAEYQQELASKNTTINNLNAALNKLQGSFERQQITIEKLVELIGTRN